MTRLEFIKICGIFGIGIPFGSSIISCDRKNKSSFSGKTIIVGAGAGGISAGYFLSQLGLDFEILEASPNFGGRIKIDKTFTDFPIPLGAEWLEANPDVFEEIVNDANIKVNINTIKDNPDRKFVNYSWYNFFEDYLMPFVANKILYNTAVNSIDYSNNEIKVTTNNGTFLADKVIVAVPLQILKDRDISFKPSLPNQKINAINEVNIWEGFKAFFEFSNKFYDDEYAFSIVPNSDGEKIYYNAAFGQNTNKNILGLFVVGKPAQDYISKSNAELKDYILNELDSIYNNQATQNYVKHVTQNWNEEPYIKGGYLSDHADWKTVKILGEPIENKVYFAGGAYTDGEDWVSVHVAALSAKTAVETILQSN